MKTKAKLTLAISVLSAAVLAAGVTSTFAWFTIDRTADVTYGNLTVDTISTIKIAANKIGYDTSIVAGGTSTHVTAPAERLGAVSSPDGKVFCAPKVLGTNTANQDFDVITNKSDWETSKHYSNKNVGFVKYAFTITADKEEDVHSLYWRINPRVDANSTHINNQWRIAMYESEADGDPVATPTVSSVVFGSAGAAGNGTAAVVNTAQAEAASPVGTATQKVVNIAESGEDKKGFGDDFTTDRELVHDFTGADTPSLTITIAVWLEGYGLANNDASGEKLAPIVTFSLQ